MKKRLFVIDGHALCYRAYFAFIKNPLKNSKGQNTSAIYGFARMMLKLISEQKPDYLAVAFDPPVKSFRFEIYSEYKANRQKMPDDLRSQIEEIKNLVVQLGIPVLINNMYEADDILGTAAESFANDACDVYIVTGDKDAMQLVTKNVFIYRNKTGISDYEILDTDGVVNRAGIPPEKIIDFMALTGDQSDNIPGVKGVGEKTALKLIAEYGSLDGVYSAIDTIKGKLKEQLEASKEMAFLSRELVTIKKNVPLGIDIAGMIFSGIDQSAGARYFRDMEMDSITKEFFGGKNSVQNPTAPQSVSIEKNYKIVRSLDELEAVMGSIKKAGFVSIDTETTSLDQIDARVVGVSLSIKEGEGWYVPLSTKGLFSEEVLNRDGALKILKPMIEDANIKKIGQNLKYDIMVLMNDDIDLKGLYFDTMIASYLIDPSERRHNLDDMAMNILNYKTVTFKELVGTGKNAVSIEEVELGKLADYAIEDADIALRLYHVLEKGIKEKSLEALMNDIELPLVGVLASMERAGVKIDTNHFKKLADINDRLLNEVQAKIFSHAGREFNVNSTRELATILFDELGLKTQKKTKTGYSTDISVLETLKGKHPVIDSLIEYRTLSKLKNTYIDTLPQLINSATGRIHTSYNQTVTATGRLSSSDPNLQNIPVRDEFGRQIRKGFIAAKDHLIISADYSQIELRLAAHLSGDENMAKAFRGGIDIHSMTASSVFKVFLDEITPDMRRQAKIINFATIYGVSPFGLSQQADIGIREAAEFIRIYFETYPGFRKYIDETTAFAREHGFVKTMLGRIRPIPDINADVSFRREGAERIAINTPIQGASADMIKIAMIAIHYEMKKQRMRSRMIMQVHDELVFEAMKDEADELKPLITSKMESAVKLSVPVKVDIGMGENWDDAH